MLVGNVLRQQFIPGSGKINKKCFLKWGFLVQSVKIHPAHCAHGRKPNESRSAPEIKASNSYGKKTPKLQEISQDGD